MRCMLELRELALIDPATLPPQAASLFEQMRRQLEEQTAQL